MRASALSYLNEGVAENVSRPFGEVQAPRSARRTEYVDCFSGSNSSAFMSNYANVKYSCQQ